MSLAALRRAQRRLDAEVDRSAAAARPVVAGMVRETLAAIAGASNYTEARAAILRLRSPVPARLVAIAERSAIAAIDTGLSSV